MKSLRIVSLVLFWSLSAWAVGPFPVSPDPEITPGSLCKEPQQRRYPEKIAYCGRHVSSGVKDKIIRNYDDKLGYQVQGMPREDFKIDHYFPLCMGGSNAPENLWPQHKSVYAYTDPLEPLICQKMSEGRLKQSEAVTLIRRGKSNEQEAKAVLEYLSSH